MRPVKAQSNLPIHRSRHCSQTQYRELAEASDKEPHLWPFWVAVHMCLNDDKLDNAKVNFSHETIQVF